jgi:hypothetical protein
LYIVDVFLHCRCIYPLPGLSPVRVRRFLLGDFKEIVMAATKMVFQVLGASRYNFDGVSGTKVFTQQDSEGNDNVVGMEVVEYSGDLALFDHFRALPFPLEMSCEVRVTRGARGKAGLRILSASPVRPAKAAA